MGRKSLAARGAVAKPKAKPPPPRCGCGCLKTIHLTGMVAGKQYPSGIVRHVFESPKDDVYKKLNYLQDGDLSEGHVVSTDEFYFHMATYDDVKVAVPPMHKSVLEFTDPSDQAKYRCVRLANYHDVEYLPWLKEAPLCGQCLRHGDQVLCLVQNGTDRHEPFCARVLATIPCIGVVVIASCEMPCVFELFLHEHDWSIGPLEKPTERPSVVPKHVITVAEECVLYVLRSSHWNLPPPKHSFPSFRRCNIEEDPLWQLMQNMMQPLSTASAESQNDANREECEHAR